MSQPDYSKITETPGLRATQEQLERLYHRYHFAKQFCAGKDVVEVACGSGIGLGYLASFSKMVVGGDIDQKNLRIAQLRYEHNPVIRIEEMDAHQLPFADNSMDVVILYEAIYYLVDPGKFVEESRRILRDNGTLIICSVNKEWKDFHPSPYTRDYFSAKELSLLVMKKFKNVKSFGAFKVEEGVRAGIISLVKRFAVRFTLIPGSLKFRGYLKRIFIGKTLPLPSEINEGMTTYEAPVELSYDQAIADFKILYVVCKK